MRAQWLCAVAGLVVAGCCGYSTRSLLPSHLRTVAVPPVENSTTQPGLGEELTDSLVAAFQGDRNLRVTTVEEANLVVNMTVTSYSRTAASYTGDQSITAYDVSITASVQAQDQVRDEEFYTGSVSAKTTYDPNASTGQSLSPEELALRRTVAKLAREAVRQVLTAW